MPIKDAIRTCKCKHCEKKFTMFKNKNGELVFFPENTVRPTIGYFEMRHHLKVEHPEIYNLYSFLTTMFRESVEDCYVIS